MGRSALWLPLTSESLSRDLARCIGVIHFDHNIDRGAADLKRAKMIDRPSGHLTPKDVCESMSEKAAETW